VFCAFYDVTPNGNWEETNILHVVMDVPEVARKFQISVEETASILDGGRAKLFAEREKRIKPGLDDKALSAWNGLMLAAFAECAAVLDRDDFRDAAIRNATFLMEKMTYTDSDGRLRLYRTYRTGNAKLNGYQEDYAFVADGLLYLYEATFDVRWLNKASELTETLLALFWDEKDSGFFATSSDHETLIQRLKDWDDNATPSGNSVAMEVLLRLTVLTGEERYREAAAKVLRRLGSVIERHPYGFARVLSALDFYLSAPKEIAIIGSLAQSETKALLRTVYTGYLPNRVVVSSDSPVSVSSAIPLLADRPMREGKPTAYVCENFACKEPVTDPAALSRQLTR
jgi:uncharacterized protein YyaL (SSP411 family)